MGTLEVEDRREDLFEGDGDLDFAALGDRDRITSEPGVDARELTLLKGSDLARILLRLRALVDQNGFHSYEMCEYLHRSGGLKASAWCSGFDGSKLACRDGGAKSILISGGDIASACPNSGIG